MSLYFLTTDQWVPSVRSNDTREWNEINAAATYRIASPPLVSEDPLHAPLRPASIGRPERGKAPPFLPEDWSTSAASSSPLSTRSRNRVRYKVGCVRVLMRDVCGAMRGAWGAGGAPVSSGLVRRLGLRVCLVYRSCCLLPAALVLVSSERAVASLCPAWSLMCPAVSARRCAGQSYSSMLDLLSDRRMPFPGQTRT